MPELPEVQTILEDLKKAGIIGCQIQGGIVIWPRSISQPSISDFCKKIRHKTILNLQRRGKYLIFCLSQGYFLCVHLRMTGHLLLADHSRLESPYIRLQLILDHGKSLNFHDTRKFGRWALDKDLKSIIGKIGPEPLSKEFTFKIFFNNLQKYSRAIKSLLLDQTFLAGLGNIYVDEVLWESQIHPLRPANQLSSFQAEKLYHNIIYILKIAIESQGTTLGKGKTNYTRLNGSFGRHQNFLKIFRKKGEQCPRCKHTIERIVVAQRGTHYCPMCQLI